MIKFLLFSGAIIANAQTCPVVEEILVPAGHQGYKVVAPSGWKVAKDDRSSPWTYNMQFTVAAWGDHKRLRDNVRCHYYQGSEHVQLNTEELIEEERMAWHAEWSASDHYYLCSITSGNVNDCPFG
jgi:hypothetical protein